MFTHAAATRCTLLLALLLAGWAIFAAVPAPITIDDVSYQLMARDLAAGRGLTIWNGYEERPSPELQLIVPGNASQIAAHAGRLVSQYPQPYAALAAPIYAAAGLAGLFWLNAVAGGVAVALCASLARRLGASPVEAALSAGIFGLCTFFADYMLGVPPHPVVSALTLGAWISFERGLEARDPRRAPLLAGLLLGAAVGVRLDAVVFAPTLVVLWAADGRGRIGQPLALAAGLAPMLGLLSWTNQLKFHAASPLSYGNQISHTSGVGAYLPALAVALPAALGLVLLARPDLRARIGPRAATLAAITAVGLALLAPALRETVAALATGSWALWGDLRDSPASGLEPTDHLSAGRAMYHWGWIKKALCQSCPWLGLLPLWAARALGSAAQGARLRRLLLLPAALTALYGLRAYHGGGSLSLRYFVPALPFLSIAAALTLTELAAAQPRARLGAALTLGALGLGLPSLLAPDPLASTRLIESFYLDLPMALCGCLALASLGWGALRALRRTGAGLALVTLTLCVATLGWAAGVTYAYDVPRRLETRAQNLRLGEQIAAHLGSGGGLVVGALAEHIGLAAERPDTRLALAPIDQGADLEALLRFHLEAGRRCLGLFSHNNWRFVSERGLTGALGAETLWSDKSFELKQFTLPQGGPPAD